MSLSRKSSVVLSDEDSIITAIKAILSFYELSLIEIKNCINTNNVNNLENTIICQMNVTKKQNQ